MILKRLSFVSLCILMWSASVDAQNNQLSNDNINQMDDATQQKIEALELLPPPAIRISDIPAYRNMKSHDSHVKQVSNVVVETESSEPVMEAAADIRNEVNVEMLNTMAPGAAGKLKHKTTLSDIEFSIDISDAHRVAFDQLLSASAEPVYFIQLAALSRSRGNFSQFRSLTDLGNIYKIYIGGKTKVKLGYFSDRWEAERILNTVKSKGFKDAFITKDPLNTSSMELVLSEYDTGHYRSSTPSTTTTTTNTYSSSYTPASTVPQVSYKVRLASYEDPIWFDIDKARKLGRIEQWTKGKWTIFILTGFNSYEEAVQGLYKAESHGFSDAEVVIDNDGILERIKK